MYIINNLHQTLHCWLKYNTIFTIEQVYSIPIGGMCVRMPFTIGGSGSTYIYGYADSNYKEGMTKQECLQFCTNGMSIDDIVEITVLDVYIFRVSRESWRFRFVRLFVTIIVRQILGALSLENKTHPIRKSVMCTTMQSMFYSDISLDASHYRHIHVVHPF